MFVGGLFATAGGNVVNGIARWDGASWRALGEGVNGRVEVVAVSESGTVYVGGSFSRLGGSPTIFASNIAAWNGTNSSVLGVNSFSGGNDVNGPVAAIVIVGDAVYVGGTFNSARHSIAGSIGANNLARRRSGTWSPFGSGATNGVRAGVGCMKNTADIADVLLFGGRSIVFEFDKLLELWDRRIMDFIEGGGCPRLRACAHKKRNAQQPPNLCINLPRNG